MELRSPETKPLHQCSLAFLVADTFLAAVSELGLVFKPLSDSCRLAKKAQRRCIDTCPSVYAGHKERVPPAINDCVCKEAQSAPYAYTARKQYERFLSNSLATLYGGNAVRSTFRITGSVRLGRHDVPDPSAEWRRKHQRDSCLTLSYQLQQLSQCVLQHAAYA